MALSINSQIVSGVMNRANEQDLINTETSPSVALYLISRFWRELYGTATRHRSEAVPQWNEKEVTAANIILAVILYLKMENCKDIEQLIRDALGRINFTDTPTDTPTDT